MQPAKEIRVRQFLKLDQIPKEDWRLKDAPYNPFHELSFLSVLEKSKVEQANYEYLIFYLEDQAIATAVLSCFTIDLSLFIGSESWVKWLKKMFPKFFKVKIYFCGIPVSIGHANFDCINRVEDCLTILNQTMEQLAKRKKVKLLVLKEIPKQTVSLYQKSLTRQNWFVGNSIPDSKMSIDWTTYEDYLKGLKSRYRRQIVLAAAGLNKGIKPAVRNIEKLLEENINIQNAEEIDLDDFYKKYLSVMSRAEVKLETLNKDYFKELACQFGAQLKYFVGQSSDGDSCYALCLENDLHLHFLWTAKAIEKDDQNCYLNQLQAMINYAIKNKIKYFHVGQTAYYPKMRIGAIPEDRFLFFKSLNPIMNPILRALRNTIFPPLALQLVQPFKDLKKTI